MGLTMKSTGSNLLDAQLNLNRTESNKIIALAGNPNVGKSTVFNNLTGLNQHTGNWPGKTVSNASGKCSHKNTEFTLVDIPGTYSLMANSVEEEVARDFICFGNPDLTIVVVDATCLERNLNLVLQTMEITNNVVVCLNLMDEAKRKGISINIRKLSNLLGVPVIPTSAAKGQGLDNLMDSVYNITVNKIIQMPIKIKYNEIIEKAISIIYPKLSDSLKGIINPRWTSLKILENEETLLNSLNEYLKFDINDDPEISACINDAQKLLDENKIDNKKLRYEIVSTLVSKAESICKECVEFDKKQANCILGYRL